MQQSVVEAFTAGLQEERVSVQRNLTIRGEHSYTVLDAAFLKRRAAIGGVSTLTLESLVMTRVRQPSATSAPSVDFFSMGDNSVFIVRNCTLSYAMCVPIAITLKYAPAVPRPMAFSPGAQVVTYLPEGRCIANLSVPVPTGPGPGLTPDKRCWNASVMMADYAIQGSTLDPTGIRVNLGSVLNLNTSFVCETFVSLECVGAKGLPACVAEAVSANNMSEWDTYDLGRSGPVPSPSPAAVPAPSPSSPAPQPSGSDGGGVPLAAIVVPCVVGGVLLLVLLGGAVLYRRRRAAGGGGAAAAAALGPKGGKGALAASASASASVSGAPPLPPAAAVAAEVGPKASATCLQQGEAGGGPGEGPDRTSSSTLESPALDSAGRHNQALALIASASVAAGTGMGTGNGTGSATSAASDARGAPLRTLQALAAPPAALAAVGGSNGTPRFGTASSSAWASTEGGGSQGQPGASAAGAAAPPLRGGGGTPGGLSAAPSFRAASHSLLGGAGGASGSQRHLLAGPRSTTSGAAQSGTAAAVAAAVAAASREGAIVNPLLPASALSGGGSGGGGPPPIPLNLVFGTDVVASREAVVGRGTFATVLEGELPDGRPVACKLFHRDVLGGTDDNLKSLKQEVAILARCQHPNIVALLGAGSTPAGDEAFLVEELMVTNLARACHEGEGLPLRAVVRIARDIAAGLAYLHPTVIHRDLKPANVLLDASGTAKLTDFGLSRLWASTVHTANPEAGTVQYMAPECFSASLDASAPDRVPITHQADVYSFGVLLWEMLARERPWRGLTPIQVALAVGYEEQRLRIPEDNLRFLPRLTKLIARCWEKDPRKRPGAAELAKRLSLMLHSPDLGGADGGSQGTGGASGGGSGAPPRGLGSGGFDLETSGAALVSGDEESGGVGAAAAAVLAPPRAQASLQPQP